MQSRRTFLAASLAAPAVLMGKKTYTYAEVEKLLARGDVKGKLSREDLPTPALVLDLDAFESNVAKMTGVMRERKRALRPHAKTHKCADIANYLIKQGAVGACAAKISEAEALAAGGVTGLLLTSSMVGRQRIERAIRLAQKRPETIFCVDNAQNARDLNDAAGAARLKLDVAIDLWVGNRTGIKAGDPAVGLAEQIAQLPNLKLHGIQAYAGQASHVIGFDARKKLSHEVMATAVDTRRKIESKGISCPWLSGGSTGTYNIDSEIEGITEIQPGSFMFMDVDYNRIGGADGNPVYRDFKNSLTVITTVISKPSDEVAIVDGGIKAFATDRQFGPALKDDDSIPYNFAGDEHGRLNLAKASRAVNLGDRLEFIIPHCDPNVNLYDNIYGTRGDAVECVWRIHARGKTQ